MIANREMACVIGLDLGTTATKGVLTGADGRLLKTAVCPVRYDHPHPGWVEADAEAYAAGIDALIRELASDAPGPVRALAASGASGNTLLTDAQGRPITPIINWMDGRCKAALPEVLADLVPDDVRRIAGWPCLSTFPLAHLAWIREHRPDALRAAAHVCMNTDWLLFRLTGQWAMDYSTATTFMLLDQAALRWNTALLERLGIEEQQLSRLTGSGVAAGSVTPSAAAATGLDANTLGVTGCFDHPSAARATGVRQPGQLLLSCGTSWVGFTPHADREAIIRAGMLCDPFLSADGGPWGGIFSVPAIGPKIDWYINEVIAPGESEPLRVFNALAAEAEPGAGGVAVDLCLPPCRIAGERRNIARSVMESAARLIKGHLTRLEDHGFVFTEAVFAGGPSKSPIWADIVRDSTGLALYIGSPHAGAEGAARLAIEGAGLSTDSHR